MSRRLDDTDLDNLEAAAHGRTGVGVLAHPTDILRLVEEVRWWKENCVQYVMSLPLTDPRMNEHLPTTGFAEGDGGSFDIMGDVVADVKVPPTNYVNVVRNNKVELVQGPDEVILVNADEFLQRGGVEPPKSGVYDENPLSLPMSELVKLPKGYLTDKGYVTYAEGTKDAVTMAWATGSQPDPKIKASCKAFAEQIRKDAAGMTTGDETIKVTIPAGTYIPFDSELFRLIREQSLPKNDDGDTPTAMKGN